VLFGGQSFFSLNSSGAYSGIARDGPKPATNPLVAPAILVDSRGMARTLR